MRTVALFRNAWWGLCLTIMAGCATGVAVVDEPAAVGGSTGVAGNTAAGGSGASGATSSGGSTTSSGGNSSFGGTTASGGASTGGSSVVGGAGGSGSIGGSGSVGGSGPIGGSSPTGGSGGTAAVGGSGGSGTGGSGAGTVVDLEPLSDSWLNAAVADGNYGTSLELHIRRWTASWSKRIVIHFDLAGSLPGGVTITNAQLCLTAYSVSHSMQVAVHELMETWVENQVSWLYKQTGQNWASQGGTFNSGQVASVAIAAGFTGEKCWDVTSSAAGYYDTPSQNYGWLLRDSNDASGAGEAAFFRSFEYGSGAAPRLQVTYVP